jgi:hypothetical protein
MTSLEKAWKWYQGVRASLHRLGRLADKHWTALSGSSVGRDDRFKELDGKSVFDDAKAGLRDLDDFAVFVLFSAFEAEVRDRVTSDTRTERESVTHPSLHFWMKQAEEAFEKGSFSRVLISFKSEGLADLIESVNQVRGYRNWVAHGRRKKKPDMVTPEMAHERLQAFLAAVSPGTSTPPAA